MMKAYRIATRVMQELYGFTEYDELWDEATPSEQAEILEVLAEAIDEELDR